SNSRTTPTGSATTVAIMPRPRIIRMTPTITAASLLNTRPNTSATRLVEREKRVMHDATANSVLASRLGRVVESKVSLPAGWHLRTPRRDEDRFQAGRGFARRHYPCLSADHEPPASQPRRRGQRRFAARATSRRAAGRSERLRCDRRGIDRPWIFA